MGLVGWALGAVPPAWGICELRFPLQVHVSN